MAIGIYIRVSTEEQAKEGYSIPAQKERLISFCASQGWTDYKIYIDAGVSAKDTNRPKLQLLFGHIREGKISTLLVYRLDRLTRSVRDLYNMLEMLENYNCAFRSATEQYDTTNAMGRMFIGLVALLAQWERENLSERTRMGLEEKVNGGEHVGGVPFGFIQGDDDKLVKNEEEAKLVLYMIDKVKSGVSVNALSEHLTKVNADKVTWHPGTILRLLRNPALYGSTYWSGKVYEHTHDDQAIITKAEWDKLQLLLDDRGMHRRRDVESTYLFQGALICPQCHHPLSVNRFIRKRKDGTEYQGAVYKCQNCYKQGRKIKQIGEQRFLDALYEFMKGFEVKYIEPVKEKDELSEYKKQLQQISKKREKYQRAWAADKMTDEEFDKLMDETRVTLDELNEKINEFTEPAPSLTKEELEKIVFTFNETFRLLNDEEKRNFVSRFIRKIEYKLIPQPPKRPDKSKMGKGKDLVVITDVLFY